MTDPCAVLADAKQKFYALITGGAVQTIETPLLGRVEFTAADKDVLARFIGEMQSRCDAASGTTTQLKRRPISFEAWP
jgi:hypothetical protein